MKKIIHLIFIILLFTNINGQSTNVTTEVLAPFPTSSDISVLRHIGGDSFVAALSESGILKTDDAGRTWYKLQHTPSFNSICDLKIFSPQRWYGITVQGEFFFTTDGGGRFFTQGILLPVGSMTPYMSFVDSLNGIICFQKNYATSEIEYYVTSNGGFTWDRKTLTSGIFKGAVEIFSWKIWIFNDGNKVRRTTNGGIWWKDTFTKTASDFFRLNDSTVIMPVKNDSVYISSDRGLTWTAIGKCMIDINPKEMMMLQNGNIYTIDRQHKIIYRSTDTCKSFTNVKNLPVFGNSRSITSMVMASDTSGIITGTSGTIALLHGTNLNDEMISKYHFSPSTAYFRDQNIGINTVGYRTTDGGKTWQFRQLIYSSIGSWSGNYKLALTKSGFGIAAFGYSSMSGYQATIHAIKDSGKTWQQVYMDTSYNCISSAEISDSLIAVLMNKRNSYGTLQQTKLFKLSNGQVTATNQQLDLKLDEAVSVPEHGMIIGITEDAVYRSKDTARTWIKIFDSTNAMGFSQLMTTSNGRVAFSVNSYNSILSSTDLGETWQRNYPPFSYSFSKLALSPSGIITQSKYEKIYFTRPGSSGWVEVPYKFKGSIINMQFTGANELAVQSYSESPYAGIYYKVIFNDSTTSIQELDSGTPGEYFLQQNYPNPFNPETVIRFALPEAGYVKGVVYDILGREVKTLLNGEMNSGNHEVKFDAKGIASGVYFFRLESGKYSSAIKMLLNR